MSDAADDVAPVPVYDLFTEYNPARSDLPALEPTLERINDRFARQLRSSLLQYLRRGVTVTPAKIELIKHRTVLARLGEPSHLTLVNMKPARGMTLVVMDAQLVATIVESRFGGDGRFPISTANREFTVLQLKLIQRLIEMAMEQFSIAWEPVTILEPLIVRHETNRQFATFSAEDDLIIVSAFHISVDHGGGTLMTCMPYVSLEPLHKQMTSGVVEGDVNYDSLYDELKAGVEQAAITLSVELGTLELTVSDLVALSPGNVFEMNRPDAVIVEAGGVPLFRGQWGRHGEKIAVRIEERLDRGSEEG
jgi:flagellar motor switch protein FliM